MTDFTAYNVLDVWKEGLEPKQDAKPINIMEKVIFMTHSLALASVYLCFKATAMTVKFNLLVFTQSSIR